MCNSSDGFSAVGPTLVFTFPFWQVGLSASIPCCFYEGVLKSRSSVLNARTRTQKYWLVLVKQSWLQQALDKQAEFSVKGVFPMKVHHLRQFSLCHFLQATSAAGFASKECLAFPSFFLISSKYEVEKFHLCHDLSDDAQSFLLFLVTDMCLGCALICKNCQVMTPEQFLQLYLLVQSSAS